MILKQDFQAIKTNKWWFFLLLIPSILIIEFNFCKQDYFWNNHYDPSYAYLMNGLNLAVNHGDIGHTDHPGTPVQMIVAVIITTTYYFTPTGNSMPEDVLYYPEYYLRIIALIFTFVNIFLVLLLGFVALRCTGEVITSLMFQSMTFIPISHLIQHNFYDVKPEPVQFAGTMILMMFFLVYSTGKGLHGSFSINRRLNLTIPVAPIAFGTLIGFIITCKTIAFPLFFFPLVLIPGARKKILYVLTCLATFLVLTIPIWNIYPKFIDRTLRFFVHSGKYGHGAANVMDIHAMDQNLINIVHTAPVFLFVLVVSITLVISWFLRNMRDKRFNILATLVIIQLISVFLVCKEFAPRYMLPVLFTIVLNLYLIFLIFKVRKMLKNIVLLSFILACFSLNFRIPLDPTGDNLPIKREKGTLNIFCWDTPDPMAALYSGNSYSKKMRNSLLARTYPHFVFYNYWMDQLTDWNHTLNFDSLRRVQPRIILYGPEKSFKKLNDSIKLKKLGKMKFLVEPI